MQPRIEVTQNTFKIVLPNMNRAQKARASTVTAQMQSVLNYIEEHGKITDLEIQNLLNIKKTRAFTLAKDMRAQGLIQVIGRGETKAYVKYNG
jgi:ATP-dependent DNA helicase RecG